MPDGSVGRLSGCEDATYVHDRTSVYTRVEQVDCVLDAVGWKSDADLSGKVRIRFPAHCIQNTVNLLHPCINRRSIMDVRCIFTAAQATDRTIRHSIPLEPRIDSSHNASKWSYPR